MKRAFAALVATVAGLVMLLDFKTHPTSLAQPAIAAPASSPPAPQSAVPASGAPPNLPSSAPTSKQPSASTRAALPPTHTVTGSSIRTRYGDVQVQVVLAGTQITDVVPVRLPDSNDVDQGIDQQAVPILIQETLAAQNANIQAVSGATYTSDGYVRSLQSALDKAK